MDVGVMHAAYETVIFDILDKENPLDDYFYFVFWNCFILVSFFYGSCIFWALGFDFILIIIIKLQPTN